jgi:hypothetical protein
MKEIVECFDRAYIINLADRTDRRRQVTRELHRLGIDVPSDKVRFYTATRPAEKAGFTDIGTRGNFTSHKNVLDHANKDRLRNVLVLEDDVSFRAVERRFLLQVTEQLSKEDWDVVFFGYLQPHDDTLTGPLLRWTRDVRGAHFYAVNGRFIGTMLRYMDECELRPRDHPEGGPMPADGAYNHVRYVTPGISVLLAVPGLAHQRSSRTDLLSKRYYDDIASLRPVLGGLRSVKHWIRMRLDAQQLRRRFGKVASEQTSGTSS